MTLRLSALLLLITAIPVGAPAGVAPAPPDPLPESEGRPDHRGELPLAGGASVVLMDGGALLRTVGAATPLFEFAAERPSVSRDGTRFVLVGRSEEEFCSRVDGWSVDDGDWTRRSIDSEGCPDRAAISPDGQRVAYVSGRTGIASVWLADFPDGPPRQLTNVGLELLPPTVGRPPAGFVAPPHLGPPRWDGDRLRWDSPDGPVEVELP